MRVALAILVVVSGTAFTSPDQSRPESKNQAVGGADCDDSARNAGVVQAPKTASAAPPGDSRPDPAPISTRPAAGAGTAESAGKGSGKTTGHAVDVMFGKARTRC